MFLSELLFPFVCSHQNSIIIVNKTPTSYSLILLFLIFWQDQGVADVKDGSFTEPPTTNAESASINMTGKALGVI